MSQDRTEARGYRIFGRVQGVGFRWWTERTACGLGLAGSVRNVADGSVEVHARGSEAALARLEAALGEGPLGARVDRVEATEPAADMPRTGFRILR